LGPTSISEATYLPIVANPPDILQRANKLGAAPLGTERTLRKANQAAPVRAFIPFPTKSNPRQWVSVCTGVLVRWAFRPETDHSKFVRPSNANAGIRRKLLYLG